MIVILNKSDLNYGANKRIDEVEIYDFSTRLNLDTIHRADEIKYEDGNKFILLKSKHNNKMVEVVQDKQ